MLPTPTECTQPTADPTCAPGVAEAGDDLLTGWQALACAEFGRPLTAAELAAAEGLCASDALDLLFPGLPDAARQEALWSLDRP